MNYGLIEAPKGIQDWVVGASFMGEVLQEDRDWTKYLPIYEPQHNNLFDTYGCVSFSAWNVLEILHKKLFDKEINKSDRFTIVKSETIPGKGNFLHKVADSIRKDWSVEEGEYPFAATQIEYFKSLTPELIEQALKQKNLEIEYRWVDWAGCDSELLWENLMYGPLQVTVYAWPTPQDDIYYSKIEETNHAVTLVGGEYEKYWLIFDHYEQAIKKLDWNYYFGSALLFTIKNNRMKLVRGDKSMMTYAVDSKGRRRYIFNEKQLLEGADVGLWGDFKSIQVIPQSELDAMPQGAPIIFGII